jgi:uncharacterized protein (DUF1501 family)
MRSNPMTTTRRRFLLGTGALAASAALPNVLFAHTGGSARLVVVILRGALDGLAAVPPYADPNYLGLHRELAIAAPGVADGALVLDNNFGLHPSFGFLHERYTAGELVVFHAALPREGAAHNTERAVAISQNVPLILRGDVPVISKSPQATPDVDEELLSRLADLYSKDDWFSARLSEAVQTGKLAVEGGIPADPQAMTEPTAASAQPAMTAAQDTAVRPAPPDRVSGVARMAATLMRSDGGPEVAVIEASGWDTHANQGGARGALAQRLAGLDKALRALKDELGPLWQQTAVLVVTEFGRTAAMNGTRGTDHGTGGCAFLAGGAVRGGRVIADWPGLARTALLDNRDLRPTLDLRSVFKAVLDEHMRVDAKTLATRIFPDSSGARPLQGLIRA